MEAWQLLFDWSELASRGTDAVAYMGMALIGTMLFVIRLILALFGGDDGGDFDIGDDGGGLGHGADSDAAFSLFSLLSILAFFMGTGWMGLTARFDLDLGSVASGILAVGVGLIMMVIASGMMFVIQRAGHEVKYDVNSAVGHIGRVYLTIPAKGEGAGQVEINVSGRRMIVDAVARGEKIDAFASVRVVELQDGKTLVVEPVT
jgi:hypothetical protein